VLQERVLDRLSERVDVALALAQIAKPLKNLAMVGSDHNERLRIVAIHGSLHHREGCIAFFVVEFAKALH